MTLQRDTLAKWIVLIIGLCIMGAAVRLGLDFKNKTTVQIGSRVVQVRVADTAGLREQGLSGTSGLTDSQGMLFVFDKPAKWAFWMKDMAYSIDIIWLDQSGKVVDVARSASPDSYPQNFTPKKDASYVLEVADGFTQRYGVDTGSLAIIKMSSW
jgi:uncharacterized protein